MTIFKNLILALGLILVIVSCYSGIKKKQFHQHTNAAMLPDSAFISLVSENVRKVPNGVILGKIRKGQKIFIDNKIGNWLLFHNDQFKSAYIWAPSAGFDYINLYSPFTYFDTTGGVFHSVEYIKKLFGSEGKKQESNFSDTRLFFGELGLGSHNEIVMEVVMRDTVQIQHGATLYIDEKSGKILRIKIDFFRPVKGVKSAIKKCDLPYRKPSSESEGHVVWEDSAIIPGLKIDLERREWQSLWFSSIWYILI